MNIYSRIHPKIWYVPFIYETEMKYLRAAVVVAEKQELFISGALWVFGATVGAKSAFEDIAAVK